MFFLVLRVIFLFIFRAVIRTCLPPSSILETSPRTRSACPPLPFILPDNPISAITAYLLYFPGRFISLSSPRSLSLHPYPYPFLPYITLPHFTIFCFNVTLPYLTLHYLTLPLQLPHLTFTVTSSYLYLTLHDLTLHYITSLYRYLTLPLCPILYYSPIYYLTLPTCALRETKLFNELRSSRLLGALRNCCSR